MSAMPTHCPFCQSKLAREDRYNGWSGCYKDECSFNFEHYKDSDEDFYDLYINLSGKRLIFQSELLNEKTELLTNEGDTIISIDQYTEPTTDNIIQTAKRLYKLKAFT